MLHHSDIYCYSKQGFPTLKIENGKVNIKSAIEANFGIGFEMDSSCFTNLGKWKFNSLEL